jgi:TrmH family RNA methyltransferase
MLSKNEVKDIQSLYRKKQRDEERLFIAEGPKLAEEIIKSDFKIKRIYATTGWLQKNKHPQKIITEISIDELSRISNLPSPNEVLLIAEQKELIEEVVLEGRLTMVLDGIQDPGNLGTIIRIADWFGIKQIICSNDCVEMYNPKVVQSTMGSITRVKCYYEDLNELKTDSLNVYGALLEGENVFGIGKVDEGLIVIGNESKGISSSLLSKITHPVTIPKTGDAESLNAAVAAGIIIGCMVNLT